MKKIYYHVVIFALIIVLANILVQYRINLGFMQIPLGVFIYPFTFLFTDILSENYSKEYVLKVVKYGILVAIIPTAFLSTPRIAVASVVTFFIVQFIDVIIFHRLKEKYYNLWWLRNNVSTLISQFLDTTIFFTLAFAFVLPWNVIFQIMFGNYLVKAIMALFDTPFFYLFAIRKRCNG
jgi:uncharacterized PurR-regulated membrane protein YhhQ (DUF165 family)